MSTKNFKDVFLNEYGYYELENPPTVDMEYVIQGDCEEILPKFITEGKKFDIINMDSVLD